MEKQRKIPEEQITARELVLNSKLKTIPAERRKGILYAEAMQLVFDKLGISGQELKSMNLKAIRHNKKMARQFETEIKNTKINVEEVIRELQTYPEFTQSSNIMDGDLIAGTETIDIDHQERFLGIHLEGSSLAIGDSVFKESRSVAYLVLINPVVTGSYRFQFPFFVVGPYFLIADDGPCHDKYAQIGIDVNITLSQEHGGVEVPVATMARPVFFRHESNALLNDVILYGETIDFRAENVIKDLPTFLVATLRASVKVSGSGSIVDVNFNEGTGMVWFPWVKSGWVGID